MKKLSVMMMGLLLLGLVLASCRATPTPEPSPACPTAQPCPDCPTPEACPQCPECPAPVECPKVECPELPTGVTEIPFAEMWAKSGHADYEAEAFRHWDEEDPKQVPPSCAKCHSETGYLDFLGVDGTAAGTVDNAAPIGTVVSCIVCHNQATVAKDSVRFPSGSEVAGLGAEARCMECHQGRASTASVDKSIADAGLADMDTPSKDLGFTNIHYFAAAATLYGTLAQGGYQYEGQAYDAKFDHVEGFDSCVDCHDSHTLELKTEACRECHGEGDPKDYRMYGSAVDYDGDGNVQEGIYYEIETLQEKLYKAIQAYSADVSGTPIVYDVQAYPYFFIDSDADGTTDPEEAVPPNGYNAWTGRLAKAAYNYQTSIKDPGAYAHGGKYIIELLYDSIVSLNEKLSSPIDLSQAHRMDAGHFASSEEAFRHWDAEGEVPGTCTKCHTASGLPMFLKNGVTIAAKPSGGLNCATCHDDLKTFTRFAVDEVLFPSGANLALPNPDNNLCLECHQGRESTVSMNKLIAGLEPDTASDKLRFLNVHYFAAGATLFGTEAKGAYEYEGKEYAGRNTHVEPFTTCTECHDGHALSVKAEDCSACHTNVESYADLRNIRMSATDFDGDGDTTEGLAGEIDTLRESLYAAMQAYAKTTVGISIVYDGLRYPYFFADADGDGKADTDDQGAAVRFNTWTPRLLQAAYNYQYTGKDPGAFAHNGKYIIQILYDSIESVGGNVNGLTRP